MITQFVKNNAIVDSKHDPLVSISYDDNNGSIKVQSFLNKNIESFLKKSSRDGIRKDIFLISCLGSFSFNDHDMNISCGIINGDGMPVAVSDAVKGSVIRKKVNEIEDSITTAFQW
jgi:hypothetical protein